jgi:CheY-like chemotaxis protein
LIGEHIAVETHFASCPLMIHADCGQIEQVLMNLVTNARDAMQSEGTLTIVTEMVDVPSENTLQTDGNQSGRYARISVTDTGTGMDETTMSRIFEPFFTTKEVGKGTGLGLSILYGIIKQHHGIVTVASRPGTGTTFTIQLPLAAPSETAAPANIFSSVQCGTELILVAEDDQSIRTVFSQILQQFGYRVLEAADGDEAIETYRNNASEISLVILDMIMPRKNGKEVFNAIAEISPEVKTLFISGYPADVITQRELLPEGEVFLLKPVSPMDLLRSIRNMLDSQGVTGIST